MADLLADPSLRETAIFTIGETEVNSSFCPVLLSVAEVMEVGELLMKGDGTDEDDNSVEAQQARGSHHLKLKNLMLSFLTKIDFQWDLTAGGVKVPTDKEGFPSRLIRLTYDAVCEAIFDPKDEKKPEESSASDSKDSNGPKTRPSRSKSE